MTLPDEYDLKGVTMDELWWDNVSPLITALESLDIDPVGWAGDPDFNVFWGDPDLASLLHKVIPEKMWLPEQSEDLIHFARGYLQATVDLTGKTWVEQFQSAGYL